MSVLQPTAGHYAPYVKSNGFVFVSGQLPVTGPGGKVPDSLKDQVAVVFQKLDTLLEDAGLVKAQVVQVRIYLSDVGDWDEVNELYAAYFGSHKPARCIVPVPNLHFGAKIELEAVAAL